MIICVKKVGKDLDFKNVLGATIEDIKSIIGANILGSTKINENIVCLYDYNNLETDNEYNFILLEEVKYDYDLKQAIKGTVVFIRLNEDNKVLGLEEEDVSYLSINYMTNTCKEVNTKKQYDTLEIFA